LYTGCEKKLKVTRKLRDASGRSVNADKVLTLSIKPGYKAGTKIKFAGEGDELPNGRAQDIEFVLEEKSHDSFTRDGNDLKTKLKISLKEALCGFAMSITMLDGKPFMVTNKDARTTQPDTCLYFKGMGYFLLTQHAYIKVSRYERRSIRNNQRGITDICLRCTEVSNSINVSVKRHGLNVQILICRSNKLTLLND
jgi:DnaJ-class molecular chaperone